MPKVTILPDDKSVEVPAGTSLLQASQKVGALHGCACGGVGACSTCHVWVREGLESLSEATEREDDSLDKAFAVTPRSRLGCQARVGAKDVVFEIAPESLESWLDEHPVERKAIEEGRLPEGVGSGLEARLRQRARK